VEIGRAVFLQDTFHLCHVITMVKSLMGRDNVVNNKRKALP